MKKSMGCLPENTTRGKNGKAVATLLSIRIEPLTSTVPELPSYKGNLFQKREKVFSSRSPPCLPLMCNTLFYYQKNLITKEKSFSKPNYEFYLIVAYKLLIRGMTFFRSSARSCGNVHAAVSIAFAVLLLLSFPFPVP